MVMPVRHDYIPDAPFVHPANAFIPHMSAPFAQGWLTKPNNLACHGYVSPYSSPMVSNATTGFILPSQLPSRYSEYGGGFNAPPTHYGYPAPPLPMDMYMLQQLAEKVSRQRAYDHRLRCTPDNNNAHHEWKIQRKPLPAGANIFLQHSGRSNPPVPVEPAAQPFARRPRRMQRALTCNGSSPSSSHTAHRTPASANETPDLSAVSSSSSSSPSSSPSASSTRDTPSASGSHVLPGPVRPGPSRSLELRKNHPTSDNDTRRHSLSDGGSLPSLRSVADTHPGFKPSKEPKLRRVVSAHPYVTDLQQSSTEDRSSIPTAPQITVSHAPTYWNPRSSSNGSSSAGSIPTPFRRGLSRTLLGIFQPHRAKIESAIKDQHAAERAWSVERPATPTSQGNLDRRKPDPFWVLSCAMAVLDHEASDFNVKTYDFSAMDSYAASVQERGPMLTPQILSSKFLVRPYQCELQKVRAIFMWMIQNIEIRQDLIDVHDDAESAGKVLARRWCRSPDGMARLFCKMVRAAGLSECHIVSGYLRAPNDTMDGVLDDNDEVVENHVWCSVRVNGVYRLVDIWLASPYLPSNRGETAMHWFLAQPNVMIFTHFPSDSLYQFLDPVINIDTFTTLPCVWAPYFDHGLTVIDFDPSSLHLEDDDICHMRIRVPDNIQCYAEVECDQGLTQRSLAQCRDVTYYGETERICKIKAVLPAGQLAGWLKIFVGQCTSSSTVATNEPQQESYQLAMCFRLTHAGRSAPFEFVKLYPSPSEFYVHEPQCYQLYPLQTYNFHITGTQQTHHKLAIKSPSGRLYKLMYYPQDRTYLGSVTVTEGGKWSLVCLLTHGGSRPVVSSWECRV